MINCVSWGKSPIFFEPQFFLLCMPSCFSCVQVFATLWTVAHQAPLSTGFSRQEYWSGLLCPPLGDLPDPGIEPASLTSPALAGGFFTTSATWAAPDSEAIAVIQENTVKTRWLKMKPKTCYSVAKLRQLFAQRHGRQHTRLPCPSPSPGVCSNSCLLSR